MIYIWLNIWPILAATLAGLVAGAIWWRLLAPPARWSLRLMLTAIVAEFWLAAILAGALILAPSSEAPRTVMALLTPVVIWAGFVLPAMLVTHAARGLSFRLALIDVGHWLFVTFVQALVLHSIGLVVLPG